jgi:putative ATP-dependent endonuclease of the OLD family
VPVEIQDILMEEYSLCNNAWMQIRKVTARNFRGIRAADWVLPWNRFVCLVGPGDSTKTSLLDVIGLVLTPRWNVQFSDADFHSCRVEEPVVLQVVIGDLPPRMLSEDSYGYDLAGLMPTGELVHDPLEGREPCVIVQLQVTDTLEPAWTVVRPGEENEGMPIRGSSREDFGLFRVDERIETHLRWGRSSALTRLTAREVADSGAGAAVTSAHRAARTAVFESPAGALHAAAAMVAEAAAEIGGAELSHLRPGLDPTSSSSTNALLLHNGSIPLTGHGLGTRRLISLAIQEKAYTAGEIVLIDEIEYGLEPHRLHHLLRHLKQRTENGAGQVIITTHSPLAVEALRAEDISVVRCEDGQTSVQAVPADLDNVRGTLRSAPSALLARRVVVCEGKTEMGVVRRFLQHWDLQRGMCGKASHAALGTAQSDGNGSSMAPARALVLRQLGYPVLLVIDHDDSSSDPGVAAAAAEGTEVTRWQPGNALEDEIAVSFSLAGLAGLVALAADIKGEESVLSAVADRLPGEATISGLDPSAWLTPDRSLVEVRTAIGAAAKGKRTKGDGKKEESKAWFKLEESGELLGNLLIERWDEIKDTPLGFGLGKLYIFAYGEDLA